MADDPICPVCMASEVAKIVLRDFADICPKVKMGYSDWLTLGMIIEECIKNAMGVGEGESHTEEHQTVQ